MPDLDALQTRLAWTFGNPELLQLALTHPSYVHGLGGGQPDNQRLEFLGDAVLSLVLTNELYARFPSFGEGPLTKARAQMVNRRTLAEQARRLGLGRCLRMSHGEEASGGRHRQSALADAFEAVVGAVFLDGGFAAASSFLIRCYQDFWGEVSAIPQLDNPKGELQEMLQARSPVAPRYHTTAVMGPDHDRVYECAVHHGGVELARGVGKSKKAAESQAAQAALEKLREKPPGEEGAPPATLEAPPDAPVISGVAPE